MAERAVVSGELVEAGYKIDEMACARNIPDRIFEAARIMRFAFPSASREHVADRLASYCGYTDAQARATFVAAIDGHLYERT